ncbi:MAG: acetyl/propionyl/methylcrotonyl-CoA carboxylase subunit alpha [Woeseiaceae bacterium]|nr:acetyl/propionyl/methylcrotonyl-CoA carboxylase subunit alpha [Gammaproteobacteria bacterium]NNK24554.1 acetyl/propionyl/methylcrotonyl-CoA carboxylase subunit alpha [Woeseiaceae bacterium]
MFKKILIANRGEIACRVIRSARQMGIRTVAVYSDADVDALHVQLADEAVHIGAAPSAESYLVIDRIVQACLDTGAEAVHPGYGFLSENSAFCEALAKKKIAFIGPKTKAIEAMGDKITSKKLADKAGVNTIPGYADVVKDAKQAIEIANDIGYPVMLKASAGGGGKGMRVARNDEECADGFERATNEAKSAFGDDRILIEKFIEEPRHIEIQVLADSHGNSIYLNERECSLQRRHQKVIEEAPSPFLDEKTRKAMGEQAVALAKAVDYESAGTVEFIVDRDRHFYFLEMNTRLQVEHPVTELTTGVDLVELMIRIAAGEKLPLGQDDVTINGWSVEARIYAEDPFRNFLPSTGRLVYYRPPAEDAHVRVDTGVYEGGEVSMFYDPMVAKLVTWGENRAEAIDRMRTALDKFIVRGIQSNIAFLAALVAHEKYAAGNISTNTIAEEYPEGFHPADAPHEDPATIVAVAASIMRRYRDRAAQIDGQLPGHQRRVPSDWVVVMDGEHHEITVVQMDGGARSAGLRHDVEYEGRTYAVRSDWEFGQHLWSGTVNGNDVHVQVERSGQVYTLSRFGAQADLRIMTPRAAEFYRLMPVKVPPDTSGQVKAPMPGLIVSVSVAEGDEVKAGDELAVLEAMKMENALRADRNGVVAKVHFQAGESVEVDEIIMELE